MLALLALIGCTGPATVDIEDAGPEARARLRFEAVAPASGSLESAHATTRATYGSLEIPVRWAPLVHVGDQPGDSPHPFGAMLQSTGERLIGNKHAPFSDLCNEADFAALMSAGGKPWLVSHLECGRGALYATELAQGPDGTLSAVRTAPLDADAVGGVFNPCSGMISPWGTLLSSEEYEPDARYIQADGTIVPEKDGWGAWRLYTRAWPAGGAPSPYAVGWTPETTLAADGSGTVEKRYAMGRFSHEIAYVLPDRKTVYLSDDNSNTGWFMFVADQPGDLSAGHLYAARWDVDRTEGGGGGALTWIPLGHATDAAVRARIDARVPFSDLFEAADPADGSCPADFTLIRTPTSPGLECLRLRPEVEADPELRAVATRLESRRMAALQGATIELNKGEGVAYDAERGRVYVALSDIAKSLGAEQGLPEGLDRVQLPQNRCGGVYAGDTAPGVFDSTGAPIASEHVMTRLDAVLMGRPDGERCAEDGLANPDNLAFVHGQGLLLVAEDTNRHAHNALWTWDVESGELTRILEAPDRGEVTGIHWYPDIGGFGYLTATIQHPFVDEGAGAPAKPFAEADPRARSHVGVLGPFPQLDQGGSGR